MYASLDSITQDGNAVEYTIDNDKLLLDNPSSENDIIVSYSVYESFATLTLDEGVFPLDLYPNSHFTDVDSDVVNYDPIRDKEINPIVTTSEGVPLLYSVFQNTFTIYGDIQIEDSISLEYTLPKYYTTPLNDAIINGDYYHNWENNQNNWQLSNTFSSLLYLADDLTHPDTMSIDTNSNPDIQFIKDLISVNNWNGIVQGEAFMYNEDYTGRDVLHSLNGLPCNTSDKYHGTFGHFGTCEEKEWTWDEIAGLTYPLNAVAEGYGTNWEPVLFAGESIIALNLNLNGQIKKIPNSINNLSGLKHLDLGNNDFKDYSLYDPSTKVLTEDTFDPGFQSNGTLILTGNPDQHWVIADFTNPPTIITKDE